MKSISKYPSEFLPDALRRSANDLLCRIDRRLHHDICRAWPTAVIIEPHTFCNLSCISCPTGQKRINRPKGKMSFSAFKELIDQISPYTQTVFWTGLCEPLLYEDSLQYLEYMTAAGIVVNVETNGHFFVNPDFTDRFVRTGVRRVNIAFDGADQDSLIAFRGPNADFKKLIQGIRLLLDVKGRLSAKLSVNLQFIVCSKNEHLIQKIQDLNDELHPDSLTFKAVGLDENDQAMYDEYMPESDEYRRYEKDAHGKWRLKGEISNACATMYHCPMILWDGTLIPCCYDFSSENAFGNVFETSFRDAWNSAAAVDFRRRVFHNRKGIAICRACPEGRYHLSKQM